MVLIRVFVTHVFSNFWLFEPLNGVLTEYRFSEPIVDFMHAKSSLNGMSLTWFGPDPPRLPAL